MTGKEAYRGSYPPRSQFAPDTPKNDRDLKIGKKWPEKSILERNMIFFRFRRFRNFEIADKGDTPNLPWLDAGTPLIWITYYEQEVHISFIKAALGGPGPQKLLKFFTNFRLKIAK